MKFQILAIFWVFFFEILKCWSSVNGNFAWKKHKNCLKFRKTKKKSKEKSNENAIFKIPSKMTTPPTPPDWSCSSQFGGILKNRLGFFILFDSFFFCGMPKFKTILDFSKQKEKRLSHGNRREKISIKMTDRAGRRSNKRRHVRGEKKNFFFNNSILVYG